jgi:hypothetical protein
VLVLLSHPIALSIPKRVRPLSDRYPHSDEYRNDGADSLNQALAGQGYLVAAPEVYHEFEKPGYVLAYDPAGTDRGNDDLKITLFVRVTGSGL